MREILFKAKRIDNGEWVEGYYQRRFSSTSPKIEGAEHLIFKSESPTVWEYARVDETTLCQYTGLTDKNGNKIWENDIVEVTYRDSSFAENYTEIGFIKYFSCSARYRYVFKEETWNFDCSTEIEVIGNIFDNPELIGGGE